VIIILLRFLLTYATRIFFLLIIFVAHQRLSSLFNEQVSLKGSSSKRALWFLLGISFTIFLSIFYLTSQIFHDPIWARFFLLPYPDHDVDFISVVWIACLSDITVSMIANSVKIVACILIPCYLPSFADSNQNLPQSTDCFSHRINTFLSTGTPL
jgi:hypothetical protein